MIGGDKNLPVILNTDAIILISGEVWQGKEPVVAEGVVDRSIGVETRNQRLIRRVVILEMRDDLPVGSQQRLRDPRSVTSELIRDGSSVTESRIKCAVGVEPAKKI